MIDAKKELQYRLAIQMLEHLKIYSLLSICWQDELTNS